jgi:hypothetical protein
MMKQTFSGEIVSVGPSSLAGIRVRFDLAFICITLSHGVGRRPQWPH